MPAQTGGKEFNLDAEMIFVDHDGTEIGIHPDSPLLAEYIAEYERKNQSQSRTNKTNSRADESNCG